MNEFKHNSKSLVKALDEYRINLIKGMPSNYDNIWDLVAVEAHFDTSEDKSFRNLFGLMGGKGVYTCLSYWDFRDQIQDYQVKNNISSIAFHKIDWYGKTVYFPEYEDQLLPMPQDKTILQRYRDKMANWFYERVEYLTSCHNFRLIKNLYCEDLDIEDISLDEIKKLVSQCEWIGLTRQSSPCPVHSSKIDPDDPSKIILQVSYWSQEFAISLHKGNLDEDDSQYFYLYTDWATNPNV